VLTVNGRLAQRERTSRKGETTRKSYSLDDEPSLRKVCQRLITSMGHDCVVAESSGIALALAAETEFDLILCDYRLSAETADDVVEGLLELNPALLPRVVIATGATTDPGVLALTAMHHLRLLAKPYGYDDIESLLAWIPISRAV
jgi:CheY-like chemotaxis protein